MSDKKITLVRHGKVNGKPALYGHTDIELSEQGAQDLRRTLTQLHEREPINNIISSPLIRCAALATAFAQEQKIPLQLEPALKEMNFGVWDGIAFDELVNDWQAVEKFWQSPQSAHAPEGETLADFAARVIDGWETLLQRTSAGHYLVVCHGGVIRILIAHVLGIDWCNPKLFQQLQVDYASHTRIEVGSHPNAMPVIKWIATPVN